MKNKVFQEYATGAVFNIQLTKRVCWGLLTLLDRVNDHWLFSGQFISIGKDLRARGLIELDKKALRKRRESREVGKHPCHKLTKAGKLTVGLLREAGLTIEKTRTLSVIKGEDLWFRR